MGEGGKRNLINSWINHEYVSTLWSSHIIIIIDSSFPCSVPVLSGAPLPASSVPTVVCLLWWVNSWVWVVFLSTLVNIEVVQYRRLCMPDNHVCLITCSVTTRTSLNKHIQWNLRITDTLVHSPLSIILRLSFIGGFWSFTAIWRNSMHTAVYRWLCLKLCIKWYFLLE